MNEWLKKVGLQKEFTIEFLISKSAFMEILENHVGKPPSFFQEFFTVNKKAYTGKVGESEFELKSNAWSNDRYARNLTITGKVRTADGKLYIDVTVPERSQSQKFFVVYLIMLFLFLLIPLTIGLIGWYLSGDIGFFTSSYWCLGCLLIFSIPYFFTQAIIRELVKDFERDVQRMVKDKMIQSR